MLRKLLSHPGFSKKTSRVRLTRIGMVFILLVSLLSLVAGTSLGQQLASEITFTGQELLGRPTDSSVMITIVPDVTIEYYYEYGTTSGFKGQGPGGVGEELSILFRKYIKIKAIHHRHRGQREVDQFI